MVDGGKWLPVLSVDPRLPPTDFKDTRAMSRRTKSLLAFASRSLSRGFGWRGRSSQATKLRAEALESRDLLSVSGTVPSIVGTVFLDSNENGTFTPGE